MSDFIHDLEWHKEHKRLGFYDPIAELYEALEKEECGAKTPDLESFVEMPDIKEPRQDTDRDTSKLYVNIDELMDAVYDGIDKNKSLEDIISELHAVEIPRWTPCSEKLPSGKDANGCLITVKDAYGYYDVGFGEYWENAECDEHGWGKVDGEVVAWMPYPKPWEGETDG